MTCRRYGLVIETAEGVMAAMDRAVEGNHAATRRRGPAERWVEGTLAAAVLIIPAVGTVGAVLTAVWGGLSLVDVGLFLGLYAATGLGITVGLHRLFSHRSFVTTPAVRAVLAVLGALSLQGPVLRWTADHRRHHAFTEREGDPHSPLEPERGVTARGLLHAHFGWFFDQERTEIGRFVPDLARDPAVVRVDRLYPLWVVLTFGVPAAVGFAATGTGYGALTGLLWGGCARLFAVHHTTWSVNSICHWWGARRFETVDRSHNHALVASVSFGEGWHNNHHAFPWSARIGLEWWQVDPGWWVVRALQAAGLAWNVRQPERARIARRSGNDDDLAGAVHPAHVDADPAPVPVDV